MPAPATPQGSSTRLLVLGCVRIFQPVHGYFLRRELVSWEVDQWAHVHPGSIYNALKSLTRSGLLEEVGVVADGPRPQRTTYRLTAAVRTSSSRCCGPGCSPSTTRPSSSRP